MLLFADAIMESLLTHLIFFLNCVLFYYAEAAFFYAMEKISFLKNRRVFFVFFGKTQGNGSVMGRWN